MGKENPGDNQSSPALWVNLWEPLLWSHTKRITREPVELSHLESDCDGEGRRVLQQPAHASWQTKFFPLCPSCNPNQSLCLSTESNWGHTLTQELGGVHICQIHILKQGVLLVLKPSLHMPRQGAESQLYLLKIRLKSSYPIWFWGLLTIPGSYMAKWHLSRGRWVELITPWVKLLMGMEASHAMLSQEERLEDPYLTPFLKINSK